MKGTFIFNHVNDIVFISIDETYKCYINKKAYEQGLTGEIHAEKVDPDVVFHNFSPLVASMRVMKAQLENAYSTVRGEDGYLLVLKEFSDYVFIAVNGDGEETEAFLQRKLRVLHRIVTFLHGPCLEELRPNKPRERDERWRVIGDLLLTWCDLHNTEQTFLVEATERLHINEQVNKTCVELLEGALNGMKVAGEKHAVHAMLVTKTKLMALFSSRNATDLSHGDQLMLLLLVNTLFRGVKVTGTHSHLATLSSREIKKRPKPSRGPVNISRQSSRTPLLEGGDTATSETDDTTDSENLIEPSDSYTSSEDAEQRTRTEGSVFQVSSENSSTTSDSSPALTSAIDSLSIKPRLPSPESGYSVSSGKQRDLSPTQEVGEEETGTGNQTNTSPTGNVLSDNSLAQSDNRSSSGSSRSRRSYQKSGMKHSYSAGMSSMPPLSVISKSSSSELTSHTDSRSNSLFQGTNFSTNTAEKGSKEGTNNQQLSGLLSDSSQMQDRGSSKQPTFRHSLSASFSQDSSQYSRTASVAADPTTRSSSALERSYNSGVLMSSFGPVPELSATGQEFGQSVGRSELEVMDYYNSTVLLKEGVCHIVPHCIHSVLLMEGVYLLIVCKIARVTHAQTIAVALSTVTQLLQAADLKASQPIRQLTDTMDSTVKKFGDILKKSKGEVKVEKIIVDINAKWEQAKQCDISKTIARAEQEGNQGRLTGILALLQDKLRQLFKELYLSRRYHSPEHEQNILNGIGNIQMAIRHSLGDYKDYIDIMAHRNMPMSIYIEEFPGMVHFMFVNRTSNVMVAPSFHVNLYADEDRTHHTSELVKQKVWQVYTWMRERLAEGVFTVTMRETDFHFSYFVWFEDNQGGFPLSLPTKSPVSDTPPLPGVICEPFYTDLQSGCFQGSDKKHVCCYELFCVHVGMVPTQYALGHCRKLKDKLWKVSVDTSAPISLL